MKLFLGLLALICETIADNSIAIPHESQIVGGEECAGDESGAEYIATFISDIFVHDTIISIPDSATASDFADVEVLLDHPKYKNGKPIRCGKKFSQSAARKLKSSEIIFICKGAGKTKALGREAADARIFIKKKLRPGQQRCLNFTGITFNTIQEDLAVMSEWTQWTECADDEATRTRTCVGILCEEEEETETRYDPCLTTTTSTTTATTSTTTTTTTTATTTTTTTEAPLQCDAGFEPNEEKTECIDTDECQLALCPENSTCTNSVGSYDCVCNEGMFGDDTNFCIPPRGCHNNPLSAGCDCSLITPLNTTVIETSWNSTDNGCTVEYMINLRSETVNSWFASVEFEMETKIVGIWRARTDMNAFSYDHGFESMYFNVEQFMEMRFHAEFMGTCDQVDEIIPTMTLCTEPAEETTTSTATATSSTTATTTTIATTTTTTTEAPLQLTDETCDQVNVMEGSGWNNADGQTVTHFNVVIEADMNYEWRIELPFDNSTSITTWNAETSVSDMSWIMTSMDYNAILNGSQTFSMQVTGWISDDTDELLHGFFCSKQEL